MQNPFRSDRSGQPFLSPLGRRRTLPPIAAPLALTAVGGVALVVAFGMLFGLQSRQAPPQLPDAATRAAVDGPAAAAPAAAETVPAAGEAASAAALPAPPPAGPALPPGNETRRATDPGSTAAIPRAFPAEAAAPDVDVAETDDEIAALEEIQAGENRDDLGDTAPAEEAAPAVASAGLRPAAVTSAVNLRAGPDNDAEVVKVLPEGARIEAEDDCRWCRVAHEGASGYVYRSFIEYR